MECPGNDKGYCRRPDLEDAIIKINISKLRICFYAHKKDNINHFYAHKNVIFRLLGIH
jgi:hypothetical protein